MNLAIKHVRLFLKSAIPKTMNAIHEGSRFQIQKRDYGCITDNTWKSAVADSEWLCKKYSFRSPAFRLMHFIPSMDGNAGIPFQNEVNRFLFYNPEDFIRMPKKSSGTNPFFYKENLRKLFSSLNESADMKKKNNNLESLKSLNSQHTMDRRRYSSRYSRTRQLESLKPSCAIDDEALLFSTNFVLVGFLFLIIVLIREL